LAQLSEIERLAERRRLLLAESERYRQAIAAQVKNLGPTAVWLDRGYSLARSLRSSWPLLAAAAGFLLARKRRSERAGRSLLHLLRRIWAWWRRYQTVTSLWRRFSPGA
jgi:hypothetical protein